jgi:type II/III secretion system protein
MRLRASVQRTSWIMIFVLLGFFASTSVQAQQEKETPKSEGAASVFGPLGKPVQRIFEVKFADVDRLAEMLRLFGPVFSNPELRVITVSGSPELVAAVEDAIKRFDVPPQATKNIELTAYLLVASDHTTSNTLPELDPVVKQLKGIFGYQGFRLLDTLLVRCRDGREGEAVGVAPSQESPKTLYGLRFKAARISSDSSGRSIRIDGLRLGPKLPVITKDGGLTYLDTGINTDLDVREGQKVVVGKATIEGSNSALFLVLTAKVVD